MSGQRSTRHGPMHAGSRVAVPDPKSGLMHCIVRMLVVVIAVSTLVIWGQLVASRIGLPEFSQRTEAAMHFALLVFLLAAAIPFVPGAEIGLALLMILGRDAAFEVYFAMLSALLLAFTAGRLVPARFVSGLCSRAESRWRLLRLRSSRGRRWASSAIMTRALNFAASNRHVTLGAVLNMPGNSILGGGGGIALLAGASRQYSFLGFGTTVAVAVLPLPLLFYILG